MSNVRLYGQMIAISIRSQLQYPASFMMMVVGHLLVTGIEFLGVVLLFARFGGLQGWSLREVALFYGLINVAWAFTEAFARGFDLMGNLVAQGTFDRVLVRPRGTILQVLGQDFQIMRLGRLMQGCSVLFWGASYVEWTPATLLLLCWAALAAVALFTGILLLQATLCFWTVQSLEVFNAFTYGGVYAAQYPISIYHRWFRDLLTYGIPLACVSYYPIATILGKTVAGGYSIWAGWLAPLAGPLFFFLAVQVWRRGVRHYRGAGS
jgi:ABC-2 type transport system permease protein